MIVTGLDLSLTATGIARIVTGDFGSSSASVHTVRSQPVGKSVEARLARLEGIANAVVALVAPGGLCVIEAPAYSRQAGARHERSGLWWLVASGARAKGCRVVEVSPTARARYATGKGSAKKQAVLAAAADLFPDGEGLRNDNEADALTLAALGCRLVGFPVDRVVMPWMDDVVQTVHGDL